MRLSEDEQIELLKRLYECIKTHSRHMVVKSQGEPEEVINMFSERSMAAMKELAEYVRGES